MTKTLEKDQRKTGRALEQVQLDCYVCPDCKTPLRDLQCAQCNLQFETRHGFPSLLPLDNRFRAAREIADVYESIYREHTDVWENQGRTSDFVRFFAGLLRHYSTGRLLEIGCGEGIVLAESSAAEKYGTDLSVLALEKAAARIEAQLSVALAESLPFPKDYFDLVASVGVMEHFLDDHEANKEICRVLKEDGHYVVLLHVYLSRWQSLVQKFSQYIFPHPRPIALSKWLFGKIFKPIRQPVQNQYTIESARACLVEAGFKIIELIHKKNAPTAPIVGPHVIIFVCQKAS